MQGEIAAHPAVQRKPVASSAGCPCRRIARWRSYRPDRSGGNPDRRAVCAPVWFSNAHPFPSVWSATLYHIAPVCGKRSYGVTTALRYAIIGAKGGWICRRSGTSRSFKAFAWLCALMLLVSVLPLYAISFYSHPHYDDYGFSTNVRHAWLDTGIRVHAVSKPWRKALPKYAKPGRVRTWARFCPTCSRACFRKACIFSPRFSADGVSCWLFLLFRHGAARAVLGGLSSNSLRRKPRDVLNAPAACRRSAKGFTGLTAASAIPSCIR